MDDFVQAMQRTLAEFPRMGPSTTEQVALEIDIGNAELAYEELSEAQQRRFADTWRRFQSIVQEQNDIHAAALRLYRAVEKRYVQALGVQRRTPPIVVSRDGSLMLELATLMSRLSREDLDQLFDEAVDLSEQ